MSIRPEERVRRQRRYLAKHTADMFTFEVGYNERHEDWYPRYQAEGDRFVRKMQIKYPDKIISVHVQIIDDLARLGSTYMKIRVYARKESPSWSNSDPTSDLLSRVSGTAKFSTAMLEAGRL